jgi:hypothetical protein
MSAALNEFKIILNVAFMLLYRKTATIKYLPGVFWCLSVSFAMVEDYKTKKSVMRLAGPIRQSFRFFECKFIREN